MSYNVVSGDTLSSIASRHHLTLGALEAANPQIHNPNAIYVGERINIPGARDSYAAPSGGQYTVRSGDTMGSIASRHGVSLSALERANPQVKDPNRISVGQRLNLPGKAQPAPTRSAPSPSGGLYTVKAGDTMGSIAAHHGVSLAALERANPQVKNPNRISVGQHLNLPGGTRSPAPAPKPKTGGDYVVRAGDSMSSIAARHGVSLSALEKANPQVHNPNVISVGQVLHLPVSGSRGSAPSHPAPPPPSGGSYTVRSGDTMSSIASNHGVSLSALEAANPQVHNPNVISVGQVLHLPSGAHGTAPTSPVPSGPAPSGFHPLTPAEFQAIAPRLGSKAAQYTPYLNQAMIRFGITTPKREAAFLAQITQETAGFDTLTEYASGREYEGRTDLGNIYPGDGVRYKGRGAIQLTGRANYTTYGRKLGLDLVNHPEIAADPSVAFLIAGQYWSDHGLNQLADQNDFIDITRRINGGTNGEATREYYWAKAKHVLGIG